MDEFEKIGEDASRNAAKVKCSTEEYREGLRVIIERLRIDIDASEEMDG